MHACIASAVATLGAEHVALAQSGTLPRVEDHALTFDEALDAARHNVPGVMAAIGQSRIAHGQVALARTPLMPFVTVMATAQGLGQDTQPIGGTSVPCPPGVTCFSTGGPFGYAFADASATARWTIWDFGRTALNVEAARRAARGAEADVRVAEHDAVLAAANAYYVLLADTQLVGAADLTLQQRRHELEIAAARVTAGLDPVINRTRAEIAVSTAELDLATARATVDTDTAALAAALGLDPAHPPRVLRPPDVAIEDEPERAADVAVAARPEVAAARLRVASAEANVAAVRAAWRPSLTANGTVGGRFTQYTSGTGALSQSGTANLVFAVPIYDPTIPANVRIAEGNLAVMRAEFTQEILAVRTEAVEAALAVRAAREQLASAQRNATLTAANLAMSEGRFAAGTAPMLELIDAEAQDATARLTVIQRQFQFDAAKIRLLASEQRLGTTARRD